MKIDWHFWIPIVMNWLTTMGSAWFAYQIGKQKGIEKGFDEGCEASREHWQRIFNVLCKKLQTKIINEQHDIERADWWKDESGQPPEGFE